MRNFYQQLPGATYLGNNSCSFRVWAPLLAKVEVHFAGQDERSVPLNRAATGYHHAVIDAVQPGQRYMLRLNEQRELPDPASRSQPEGVHGPAEIIDHAFPWSDEHWFGVPLSRCVIYELHVGTFTPEGTFDAVIPHLQHLKELGITAIEIMPVAQFPGGRNWGYDGVYLYAVQNSYGGPHGLKRLVNACHEHGMAVILDVVYNHLGPEGNYLGQYAPYFTQRYKTPWGEALNFDGEHSDEVRAFFIGNALYWQTDFHIDALRLDAVHAICDASAEPFLRELARVTARQAERINKRFFLIAESNLNDTRVLQPWQEGGFGHTSQWSDDFHHALHTILTGEKDGYYVDFGTMEDLVRAWRDSFVYDGRYSRYRGRRHGNSARHVPGECFVVSIQNHDQIGNRFRGDRLSQLVDFESLKVAAACMLLSPYVPMLFMGEEYGETAPFPYFVSHGDAALVEAVRRGRREEFADFAWTGDLPDPQAEATFHSAKLQHHLKNDGHHKVLQEFYRELLRLRNSVPALSLLSKELMEVAGFEKQKVLFVRRWTADDEVCLIFNLGPERAELSFAIPSGKWSAVLVSKDERWRGAGSAVPRDLESPGEVTLAVEPKSCVVYTSTSQPRGSAS